MITSCYLKVRKTTALFTVYRETYLRNRGGREQNLYTYGQEWKHFWAFLRRYEIPCLWELENRELGNSVKFLRFQHVSQDDCTSLTGKFGQCHDCKWKPCSSSVNKENQSNSVHCWKKSRQEFKPLQGKLCEKWLSHFILKIMVPNI